MILTALVIGVALAQAARGPWEIPLVPFGGKKSETRDNRVFAINAALNEGAELKLALDTNVGTIVVTESAAERAGLKLGSAISMDWAGGEKIRAKWIRGFRVTAGKFSGQAAYGLAAPDDAVTKLHPLDGVIGLSFLQNFRWSVDPKRDLLILTDPDTVSGPPLGDAISFVTDRGKGIEIKVTIGGKSKEFVAHTGLSDVFVDTELAKELGLTAAGPVLEDAPVPYMVGPKVTLQMGTVKVPDVQVFIAQKQGWRHIGQSVWNRF
ncbi:MAG: hypothetical protein HRF45_13785, partial [Fimbriimonadia bacterium]